MGAITIPDDLCQLPADGGDHYNRLVFEKSPYLLQHADNPVDWFPWAEEAFERARQKHQPIFLSIGYSTCHWCHVMAHESFEDSDVAQVLNQHFVSIKVDREERPDIDATYMAACQLFSGQGGWPLTIVMTPDKLPFFAATYLPRQAMRGQHGIIDILMRIDQLWQDEETKLIENGQEMQRAILAMEQAQPTAGGLHNGPLQQVVEDFRTQYDATYGGFGSAPKFPSPHNLSLLLQLDDANEPTSQSMALETLKAIHLGGITDQIGGGLHRYSVDAHWLVPHFEKMLYDQAMITQAFVDAWHASGDRFFAEAADDTCNYVIRDLQLKEGAFCCGEDADSEGAEGTFYLWDMDAVLKDLPTKDAQFFCERFQLNPGGNFEGRNIPHLNTALSPIEASDFQTIRQQLFNLRSRRPKPHRDDKVLTSWNGLMIAALARTGVALERKDRIEQASQAANFIWLQLRTADGRLLRRFRQEESAIPGFLEDYAFYSWGLLELYLADFDHQWLKQLGTTLNSALALFTDGEGGLFETGKDAEVVLGRGRSSHDGAHPSATSVMALTLSRAAVLTRNKDWKAAVEPLLQQAFSTARQVPTGYAHYLQALRWHLAPGAHCRIVVPTNTASEEIPRLPLLQSIRQRFLPLLVTDVLREDDKRLKGETCQNSQPTAYFCLEGACQAPTSDIDTLKQQIELWQKQLKI